MALKSSYAEYVVDHHNDPNHDEWTELLSKNFEWASEKAEKNPEYFAKLASSQVRFLLLSCMF